MAGGQKNKLCPTSLFNTPLHRPGERVIVTPTHIKVGEIAHQRRPFRPTMKIREYRTEDRSAVCAVALAQSRRGETKRTLMSVWKSSGARWTWQAGVVGLVGLHWSSHSTNNATAATFLVELLLWSAGVGLSWFWWLKWHGQNRTQALCQRIVETLETSSHAWVMEKDGQVIVGSVALQLQEEDGEEGRIRGLTGVDSRIELALVQSAIQFARRNNVRVITKSGDDARLFDSSLLN